MARQLGVEAACVRFQWTGNTCTAPQLGLTHAAESLPRLLGDAVKEEIPVHRFLDLLLQTEQSQREERRIKTSLKLSGLPTGQTLGSFDWAFQPGIERSRIETLATCAWIVKFRLEVVHSFSLDR